MRVAWLGQGDSIHTVKWVNALSRSHVEVHLITQEIPRDQVHADVHILPRSGRFGYIANQWRLRSLLRRLQPNLLHSNYASGYGTLGRLSRFHPHLVSAWGDDVFQYPWQNGFNLWNLRRTLTAADRVAATSHALIRQIDRITPLAKEVATIPFGVDLEAFRPAADGRRNDPFTVAVFKHLDRAYGVDLILEAWARFVPRAKSAGQHPQLILAGTGPDAAWTQRRVHELKLSDTVSLPGRLANAEVADRLRRTDAVLNLSRFESFGVAILEALASGVPVIATDVGGVPEVLPASAGYCLPVENVVERVPEILFQWLLQPEESRRMGMAGRRFVAEHYSQTDCVGRLLELYRDLLR